MWTGVLYDATALGEALELSESFAALGTAQERHSTAAIHGLEGLLKDQPIRRWAEALFHIGEAGLQRYQPDATELLLPLQRILESGSSPAQFHRQAFHDAPSVLHYLKAIAYSSA